MAIVFALRADNSNYSARYSLNSVLAQAMGSGTISYDVDGTAINGHNFNLDQGSATTRVLQYPFRGVHTAKQISVLIRMKLGSNALMGFWNIGQAANYSRNTILMFQNANLYQITAFSDTGGTVANGSFAAGVPATGVWTDMVLTWDGTTTASKLKLWIDGVATSTTAGVSWPTTTFHDCLAIGGVTTGVPNARFVFEEFVVWNTEIDPTSVALVSGTGSLNGASRTSLVDVAAFDGSVSTDPLVANVKSGTSYTIAGVSKTGTYAGTGSRGRIVNAT